MTTVLLALLMQYAVVSNATDATNTGFVNYIQGAANVKEGQTIEPSEPVRTGPNAFGEILLVPGSFLRVGPNSEVVFDKMDLVKVDLRLNRGVIMIEVIQAPVGGPLKLTTGNLSVEIADAGIYRFDDNGTATVIEGKLLTVNPKVQYKKGWQLSYSANYRAKKVSYEADTILDVFSRNRSEAIATANASLLPTITRAAFATSNPQWVCYGYRGNYRGCTFLPDFDIRSPYGFRYLGYRYGNYGNGYRNGQTTASNSNNTSGGSTTPPPASNSGSGSASPPAPAGTVAVPSGDRTTRSDYSNSKAPSAGVQQPPPNEH